MENVKQIFNICTQIMQVKVNLFGYQISLLECTVYLFVVFVLVRIIRALVK